VTARQASVACQHRWLDVGCRSHPAKRQRILEAVASGRLRLDPPAKTYARVRRRAALRRVRTIGIGRSGHGGLS
jgi:hypothetical protein